MNGKRREVSLNLDHVSLDSIETFSDFLQRFHALHSGSFPEVPTTLGPSSYGLLVEALGRPPPGRKLTILDLGCGDGRLLELIAAKGLPGVELIGVDFVLEQIERSRRRLGKCNVTLLCEPAQKLSLSTSSVDRVLVHMSLAFMHPLEDTLHEIDRVLRPGGVLAMIADGTPATDSIDRIYSEMLWDAVTADRPEIATLELGGSGGAGSDLLISAIREQTSINDNLEVLPFDLLLNVSADEYLEFVEGDYLWKLLSADGAQRLREQIRRLFAERGERRMPVPVAMRRIVIGKPDSAVGRA